MVPPFDEFAQENASGLNIFDWDLGEKIDEDNLPESAAQPYTTQHI